MRSGSNRWARAPSRLPQLPRSRPSRAGSSRRLQTALAELLARDLSTLDLVGVMIDGVHFGEHTCVVALGIDIGGTKHPLSLVEGSTENATLVTELIVGLRERGLDVTRPILVVLDGSKALRGRCWMSSTARCSVAVNCTEAVKDQFVGVSGWLGEIAVRSSAAVW
jgi:hypothetical protein